MLRRQVLQRIVDLCIAAPLAWLGLNALVPTLFRHSEPNHAVIVGKREELFRDSKHVVSQVADIPAIIFDRADGIVAYSLLCTHAQCVVHFDEKEHQFLCPCHGGAFDEHGNVTAAPPTKPLQRLFVSEHKGVVYLANRVLS